MVPKHVQNWLNSYTGDFEFYLSLQQQLHDRGTLSDKQIAAIERAIEREKAPKVYPDRVYTLKPGTLIEIKAWLARRIQKQIDVEYMFRNLRVVTVTGESAKAWQVTLQFVAKVCKNCHICAKELDTPISRATGIGPVCARKLGIKRFTIENAHDVLAQLNELARKAGTIGPIWMPKSQVISRELVTGPSVLEAEGTLQTKTPAPSPYEPTPGTYAFTARFLAESGIMTGEEADRWKEDMKQAEIDEENFKASRWGDEGEPQ